MTPVLSQFTNLLNFSFSSKKKSEAAQVMEYLQSSMVTGVAKQLTIVRPIWAMYLRGN